MDQIPSSYYAHQGTADSVMGLQGSPSMNMLSNPAAHFQMNTGENLMGSLLPLGTPSTMSPHGTSVGPPPAMLQGEPVRRKRGRPRKYGRDAAVSLALSPSTSSPAPFVRPNQKRRGRPPGTGRKQTQVSLGGSFVGYENLAPCIISVAVGEDIKSRILSFAQGRPAIAILSGNGTISAVNLRQPNSGRSVTYEGQFDILTLNGSYTQSDQGLVGDLTIGLACPDGRLLGGRVDNIMVAGGPVQVVVASLLNRGSKIKRNNWETPMVAPASLEM